MVKPVKKNARDKLLEAALTVIRGQGYAATTVDELCAAAGVTKGAFFHHFKSKDELAVAAADYWSEMTEGVFAQALYHAHEDPLDRVIGYLEFRKDILQGALSEFTCLVGTMVQETYDSHPAIREACDRCISGHAAKIADDIQAAMRVHGVEVTWSADSLALYSQAVLQGSFILAKARGGAAVAADNIDHLIRYVNMLFGRDKTA